jgi:hypothetical protein
MKLKFVLCLAFAAVSFGALAQQSVEDKNQELKKKGFTKLPDGNTIDPVYVNKMLDQKLNLLKEDINVLIQKKNKNLSQTVANAFKLWNNDKTKMITTTGNGAKSRKPVQAYLTAMEKLPYKSADIKYGNYTVLSNITKGPDGRYRGFVEFTQEFTATGTAESQLGRIDKVSKTRVEVIIEVVDFIDRNGVEKHIYELFLGDMTIHEIR